MNNINENRTDERNTGGAKNKAELKWFMNRLILCGQYKKRGLQGVEVNESRLAMAKRERSQASLCLEPLVVIEVNVFVNQVIGPAEMF